MPYYDLYIGGVKYKLYLKDGDTARPFNVYMHDKGGIEPYGKLSYIFDPTAQTFNVKIDELSDRGKYLLDNGWLYIAVSVYDNRSHCNGMFKKIHKTRWRYRNNRLFSRNSVGTLKPITDISQDIIYNADEIPIPASIKKINELKKKKYAVTEGWLDFKFSLSNHRNGDADRVGDVRFVKTYCPIYRLTF